MKKFEELIVWQKAMEFAEAVYKVQRKLPREETYGLGDQIRRAAVSVPSNIAEGCGRDTDADFQRFLCIARGSLFEVRTQLDLAVSGLMRSYDNRRYLTTIGCNRAAFSFQGGLPVEKSAEV